MLEPSEPTQHILRGPFWESSSSHGLIDSLSAVSTPVPLSLCSSIVMEQLEVKRGRTLWEGSWGLKEPKGHGGGREEREGLKGKSSVPHEWMNSIIIHGLAKATVSGHLESLNFLLSLTVMNNLCSTSEISSLSHSVQPISYALRVTHSKYCDGLLTVVLASVTLFLSSHPYCSWSDPSTARFLAMSPLYFRQVRNNLGTQTLTSQCGQLGYVIILSQLSCLCFVVFC